MDQQKTALQKGRWWELDRRQLFRYGMGMGWTLSPMAQVAMGADKQAQIIEKAKTHAPTAKSVIFLSMYGGPSQIETFDYKPALEKYDSKTIDIMNFDVFIPEEAESRLMKSLFSFSKAGDSGIWISEIFPHLSTVIDEMAVVKSCQGLSNNHPPAILQMNSGHIQEGYPCLGSWVNYALGSENNGMPGHIVMVDPRGAPFSGAQNWSSGFLPGSTQGTPLRSKGEKILYLDKGDVSEASRRAMLDLLAKKNQRFSKDYPDHLGISAQVENLELANRMEKVAPVIIDVDKEPDNIKSLYGLNNPTSSAYGSQLLMARRLVEQGVRFVQVYSGGRRNVHNWDSHEDMVYHRLRAQETDQPIAGLIKDLKQRGMLDETLIVWSGEFGRLPITQGVRPTDRLSGVGRDHNPHAFSMWMAGGGIKGGVTYGETDEIGHKAAVDKVTWPDLHATILHLLGLDHEKLTYKYNGRPFRLTDVSGYVLEKIIKSPPTKNI